MDVKVRESPQQSVVGGLIRWGGQLTNLSLEGSELRIGKVAKKACSLVVWDSHDGFSYDGLGGSFVCKQGKQIKLDRFRPYLPLYGNRLGKCSEWGGQSVVAYPAVTKKSKSVIVMENCETGKLAHVVDLGEETVHDLCWIKKSYFASISYEGNDIDFWHPKGHLSTWPLEKFKATSLGGSNQGFMCGTNSGHIFSFSKSSTADFTLFTNSEVTTLSTRTYGRFMLSGHGNGNVKVWDIGEQKCMKTFSGKGRIHSCYMLGNLVVAHCDEGGYRGRRFMWSLAISS